jgi:hypothetical protein
LNGHSEGDRLSGLVVDVIGTTAVVSASAAWVALRRGILTPALLETAGLSKVYWRPNLAMLAMEGLGNAPAGRNPEEEAIEGPADADADADAEIVAEIDADADAVRHADVGADKPDGDLAEAMEQGDVSRNGSEVWLVTPRCFYYICLDFPPCVSCVG